MANKLLCSLELFYINQISLHCSLIPQTFFLQCILCALQQLLFSVFPAVFLFNCVCVICMYICTHICLQGSQGGVVCHHFILSLSRVLISLLPPQLGWQLVSLSDTPASVLLPLSSLGSQVCAHRCVQPCLVSCGC